MVKPEESWKQPAAPSGRSRGANHGQSQSMATLARRTCSTIQSTMDVVALLDWEFAHQGDPTEDLAWAEWIVRTHHPTATTDLASLSRGMGKSHRGVRGAH